MVRFILDKKIGIGQPKRIENVKIFVANTTMDTNKVKIYVACVRVVSMSKDVEIEGPDKEKMIEKLIYNFPEELFADAGILAIQHADSDGIERLALVAGGGIASTFDNPESVKVVLNSVFSQLLIMIFVVVIEAVEQGFNVKAMEALSEDLLTLYNVFSMEASLYDIGSPASAPLMSDDTIESPSQDTNIVLPLSPYTESCPRSWYCF
ncbi:putative T-complex protein 1 subunit beta [Morus notabilis]|uniref:Putative T-complex protein 1 subunit beta n=1 Tax=Morus notabilis TaxID=981085 RepID=W9SDT4_9ROSA|nr:T-complex protein 1 subunit beta [Morus notabilis]EXC27507.1 putative T-complex protein 1 subunit beta [Morus notabilis]